MIVHLSPLKADPVPTLPPDPHIFIRSGAVSTKATSIADDDPLKDLKALLDRIRPT